MPSHFAAYKHDPIRGRLAPKLARLMESSGAEYCALVWCTHEQPGDFHPYLTLTADGKPMVLSVPDELEQSSRRESLVGRLSSGQTRSKKWAGVFVAEREGRSWFLVLHSRERLRVGRDLGRGAEIAVWGAAWAVTRIGHVEPAGRLATAELLATAEAAEEASSFEEAASGYGRAYEVSLATGDTEGAIVSSWYGGRALRKLADWDAAVAWYNRAREVALDTGRLGLVASVTVGLANVRLHKGALGEARDLYRQVVDVGTKGENRQAVAQGYFGLMWVYGQEEDWTAAARVGWAAFTAARGLPDEWDILVALGGCFRMAGRIEEAKACNVLAMRSAPLPETRQLATCNLAVISALAGDELAYMSHIARVDPDTMSARGHVEVLAERGQALCALGREQEGRQLMRVALRQAEELKFGKLVFDIEQALELDRPWEPLMGPNPTPREREDIEIRTQLELLAAGV